MNIEKPTIVIDIAWKPRAVTLNELEKLARDPEQLVIVADAQRIGMILFFTTLEHEYFPPVGPVNDLFQMERWIWPDPLSMWVVGFLPMRYRTFAESVAKQQGMRFNDGFPWIGDYGRARIYGATRTRPNIFPAGAIVRQFPLNTPNVFTLETDAPSAVYDNNSKTNDELRRLEKMQVEAVETEFREKYHIYFEQLAEKKRLARLAQQPTKAAP